ncbi:MAG: S41 family peptidase [Ferruginibacter sp.]|nr:S41 family peptidase [Ferruginibacter sp.]
MERKKLNIWLPFLFALSMIGGLFLGYKMRDAFPTRHFFALEKSQPLQEVVDLIREKYVDEVSTAELMDTAILSMLTRLDPHTQYIPPNLLESANDDIAGSFYGIGIEFDMIDDTLHVVQIIPGGPAATAGLKNGDRILAAGDSILSGREKTAEYVRSVLKGNRGSAIRLQVLRGGTKLPVEVKRDIVAVNSVTAAYMINDSTGFIHLDRFSQPTYREFMIELEKLVESGMKQLILDVRGNGGGIMDAAVEIADEFLSGDKLITYTEGAHKKKEEYRCRRNGMFETGKLVVLADEGTASASEILIGALQDWDRATVVGRRTFGKGLVQEQFNLSNRGALRLTVSRYYTPLGRSIQRTYQPGNKDYFNEIHDPGFHSDSAAVDTTGRKFKTAGGKTLYEGGGIAPDVWVASDTSSISYAMAYMYGNRLVNQFTYLYPTSNPTVFNKYKTPDAFRQQYSVDENALRFFNQNILKDSVNTSTLTPSEMTFLMNSMKNGIARQLWRNEGYYRVQNAGDEAVQKALEILHKR